MHGTSISIAEVTNVSSVGFWLMLDGEELLLPFNVFLWFKSATIEQLCHVERPSTNHLYWPKLDVDLSIASIRDPAAFLMVAKT